MGSRRGFLKFLPLAPVAAAAAIKGTGSSVVARGGFVRPMQSYWIGESGPETIVPAMAGKSGNTIDVVVRVKDLASEPLMRLAEQLRRLGAQRG